MMTNLEISDEAYRRVQEQISAVVESGRSTTVRQINSLMTATYWEIGRRLVETEQDGQDRAAYGQALVQRLAVDLTTRFGRGFSRQNLWNMRGFHLAWPTDRILQTVSGEFTQSEKLPTMSGESTRLADLSRVFPLPWSAYVRLLTVKNDRARWFYEAEALRSGWSVRQLERQINSQFYERAALSSDKESMLEKSAQPETAPDLTPEQAIKDPFVLEFLDLKDEYSESDLENALIEHLTDFLLELGDDFAFVGRQRRLRLDDRWFRVDLLFFHRRLRCLLIIDLKVGRFSYADAGQMQLYLNYAKEHWIKPGENPPVGLVLAATKGAAEAHYALEGLSNQVLAAEYQTVLPNEKVLAAELKRTQQALEQAKSHNDSKTESN